jgi:hypothetical protein
VYTQGLEFNANYKLNENVTISGGYQLLYAKDKEAEQDFEDGQVFARFIQRTQPRECVWWGEAPNQSTKKSRKQKSAL